VASDSSLYVILFRDTSPCELYILKKMHAVISEPSSVCGNLLRAVFKVVVRGQTSNITGKVLVLSYASE
jgi:hypothetical protein